MWDYEGKAEGMAMLALGAKATEYHGTVLVVPRGCVFSSPLVSSFRFWLNLLVVCGSTSLQIWFLEDACQSFVELD